MCVCVCVCVCVCDTDSVCFLFIMEVDEKTRSSSKSSCWAILVGQYVVPEFLLVQLICRELTGSQVKHLIDIHMIFQLQACNTV